MLKKLCDNCKQEIPLDTYDEGNFNITVSLQNSTETIFSGDLCEKCEEELIEKITVILEKYGIKEEFSEEEENQTYITTEKGIELLESKDK